MQNYILKNTIKFALFIFGLSFSKLVLGTAIGNSPIDFSGPVGASISGDSVTITIQLISNSSSTYTSGSLRIELWATSTPYSGGSITGTRTALIRTFRITGLTDTIEPNYTFSNITINTSYTTPPSSNTNFTLILTEYSESCSASDGFCIIAYAPLSGDSDSSDYTISGTILDENGAAVSGATIMLTGAGQTFSTSTNSAGSFSLTFPREGIPDAVAYVVVRDGFIPVAQGFYLNSSGSSNIGSVFLEELGPETVLIEVVPELHHLGDNDFGGSFNSQFQQSSEGTTFSRNFSVTSTQLTGTSATVTLLAKGLQESNQLSINGYSIGTLDSSPSDGSFASVGFSGIPIGIFNAGVNTLTIRSDQNGFGDYDDFEFTNVVIQFVSGDSDSSDYTISGTILDENGAAVSGATIMLTGAGQTFSTSTNSAGSFSLTFPREGIPDAVAYVVVRDGFIPVAQGFYLDSSGSSNIGSVFLEELGPETVLIEVVPELHHLGDNDFGGSFNSQFQQSSEGTTFSRNFSVTSTQLTGTSATVTLLAKGLQYSNQLSINGYSIGTLDSSPSDGSFASVGFSGIPIGIFNAGVNTLTIRSVQNDDDYDDFEFTNVVIQFVSGDSDSSDYTISGTILDENGAAVSGATIMLTGAGQTFSTSTNSAGSFSLTFPREGIPDAVAYVVVRDGFIPVAQGFYLDSSGSSNIGSVSLEELGPETVLIEVVPELHHLGDNDFGGSFNSQFQQSSEGTTFSRNFSVTSTQLTGTSATVTLLAKGLQESNQLSINGYSIGTLDSSPSDGSFASVGFSGIPIGIFNAAAVNTLTIRSDQNGFGDYDDFEFTNVVIQFENISSSSTNPDSPAHSGTYQSIYGINIMPLGDGVLSGNSDSASENGSLQTSDFDLGGGVYLDVYEFTLHDANTVDFSLSTSGYSSVVYLVRIDGNQGVISLETLFQTSNANSALRQLSAGTYWIGVSGLTPFSLGSYDLNVLSAIATSSSGGSFDSVYGFPVEFLTGNVVNGTLNESDFQLEDQSYFDVFQFTVNQTTDYRIELSSDDIDTYLYVARILDNQIIDNEVFFFDDDSGAGTNSIVNGSLPPGTYWIVATSYGPNDTGSYSLTLIRDL